MQATQHVAFCCPNFLEFEIKKARGNCRRNGHFCQRKKRECVTSSPSQLLWTLLLLLLLPSPQRHAAACFSASRIYLTSSAFLFSLSTAVPCRGIASRIEVGSPAPKGETGHGQQQQLSGGSDVCVPAAECKTTGRQQKRVVAAVAAIAANK
jgi:hypothetical protein